MCPREGFAASFWAALLHDRWADLRLQQREAVGRRPRAEEPLQASGLAPSTDASVEANRYAGWGKHLLGFLCLAAVEVGRCGCCADARHLTFEIHALFVVFRLFGVLLPVL